MKTRLFVTVSALCAFIALAGCKTAEPSAPKTEAPKAAAAEPEKDPNPYYDYRAAMASDKAHPMAVEWQNANDAKIAEATAPAALAAVVKDADSAAALLAEVRTGYATDAFAAVKIAAVTQYVMAPERAKTPVRELWVSALRLAEAKAEDDYRRAFFRDQLFWCSK